MRLRAAVLLTMLMVSLVSAEDFSTSEEEVDDRDKRQTQTYFTSGLSGVNFRPTPKPQPFAGGPIPQNSIPRFQVQVGEELTDLLDSRSC